jgi:hypothetical protein
MFQKRMFVRFMSMVCLICFLGGCATAPSNISASYVSPLQYQNSNCDQLQMELTKINQKVVEVSNSQQNAATKDAVALGVGLVLFWPALIFMIGGDRKEELANLKGQYEALECVSIQKECEFVPALLEAKKAAQERDRIAKAEWAKQPATSIGGHEINTSNVSTR